MERASKLFAIFFIAVLVIILVVWGATGYFVYKTGSAISEKGVRGVAESLYCGKTPDCKLP